MSLPVCGYWTTVSNNLHRFGSFVNVAYKFSVTKDVACWLVIEKYHVAKYVIWLSVSVKCKLILCCTHTLVTRFFICTLVYVGGLNRFFLIFFPWLFFDNLVVFIIFIIIINDWFCAVRFIVSFLDAVVADWFLFPLSGSLRCFGVPLLRERHY